MDELKLRDEWFVEAKLQTLETLPAFLKKLAEYNHGYGTIPRAIAAAAYAAAKALDRTPNGGITGFQAGFVMWDFIQEWMGYKNMPLKLVDYSKMLYPQYEHDFINISKETWEWLQKKAKESLKETEGDRFISNKVVEHWKSIVEGKVPFGFKIEHQ